MMQSTGSVLGSEFSDDSPKAEPDVKKPKKHNHDYKFIGIPHPMFKKAYYSCRCGAITILGTVTKKRKSKTRK